jgi:hypothetical protein
MVLKAQIGGYDVGRVFMDAGSSVGVLDTGVSRSTCSWAPSSAHLQPREESTTKATEEDPHEEAPREENDDGNC